MSDPEHVEADHEVLRACWALARKWDEQAGRMIDASWTDALAECSGELREVLGAEPGAALGSAP